MENEYWIDSDEDGDGELQADVVDVFYDAEEDLNDSADEEHVSNSDFVECSDDYWIDSVAVDYSSLQQSPQSVVSDVSGVSSSSSGSSDSSTSTSSTSSSSDSSFGELSVDEDGNEHFRQRGGADAVGVEPFENSELFSVLRRNTEYNAEFYTEARQYVIQPRAHMIDAINPADALHEFLYVLSMLIAEIRRDFNPHDYVQLTVESENLREPVTIPFRRVDQLDVDRIFGTIEKVLNSQQDVSARDDATITVTRVAVPRGGGKPGGYEKEQRRKSLVFTTAFEQFSKAKKSLITIFDNVFPLCGVVALYLGLILISRGVRAVHNLRRYPLNLMRKVKPFLRKASLSTNLPLSILDVKKVWTDNEEFRGIQLIIYQKENADIKQVVCTPYRDDCIALLLQDDHYSLITKIPAFLCHTDFCRKCNKACSVDHVCDRSRCSHCKRYCDVNSPRQFIHCDRCNRDFISRHCFEFHSKYFKRDALSTCQRWQACPVCRLDIRTINNNRYGVDGRHHFCYKVWCKMCNSLADISNHFCCMKPAILSSRGRKIRDNKVGFFLFFDVEAAVDASGKQIPNLICCQWDDGEEIVFRGEGCRDEFCRYIFSRPLELSSITYLVAHNLGGYDCNFIFAYVAKHVQKKPENVIMKNGRLISCSFLAGKLVLRDSLLFFHVSLSKLPALFNLDNCDEKGFFPHAFNTPENWEYEGPLPERKYYSPELHFSDSQLAKFDDWYSEMKDKSDSGEYVFNLQDELYSYCSNDVKILRLAVEKL